jgi:hypothetical protein
MLYQSHRCNSRPEPHERRSRGARFAEAVFSLVALRGASAVAEKPWGAALARRVGDAFLKTKLWTSL